MHDALTVGIPTFVILMGILFNRIELRDLKATSTVALKSQKNTPSIALTV